MSPPKPGIAYKTYWRFAFERQAIFFKRLYGKKSPWTQDTILASYKFTNVYRATDRVSQFLIKNILYQGSQEPQEIFFRLMLFKLFNRISTWDYLTSKLGCITYKDYSFKKYDRLLSNLMNNGIAIYSAAYIMASGRSNFGYRRKHQNHLKLIEMLIQDGVPYKLHQCKTMHEAYKLLLSYPTIGEFLAYQYATDINYSSLTNFSEMEFVKAGPGAKDGITKCFRNPGDYTMEDIIRLISDIQTTEFERYNLNFRNLWGRNLQLIDCQNIFCEVDKYSRMAHPELNKLSQRTRIKQKFVACNPESYPLFFPPDWQINTLIDSQ